jgi:hypothetical protein
VIPQYDITSVSILRPQPGDVVVLAFDTEFGDGEAEAMQARATQWFGGLPVVVLGRNVSVCVIRPPSAKDMP